MDRITSLRAFVRLAELGSFSAVAQEMRIGQPTVSKWLAALEEEFGATLIDRTTRTQRVTEAGDVLLERARHIVAAFDQAKSQLTAQAPELAGRLRLSAPVVFGPRWCAAPLFDFMAAHPGVECEVVYGDRYVDLVSEAFDLAIRVGVRPDSQHKVRTLATTPRRLVAAPAYLEEHGTPKDASDMSAHRCVLLRSEASGPAAAQSWVLKRAGYTVRARAAGPFAANNSAAVLEVTRLGGGIARLAAWLVDDAVARGELVVVLPAWDAGDAPISAVLPPGRFVAPRVRALVNHLSAHFAGRFDEPGAGANA